MDICKGIIYLVFGLLALLFLIACVKWIVDQLRKLKTGLSEISSFSQVQELQKLGDVKGLIEMLHHEEGRSSAAMALVQIGKPAVASLIDSLKDADERVRLSAISTLGEIGDAQAVDPLVAALEDDSSEIRRATIRALGQIRDARAVDPLIATLNDTLDVRSASAKALGQIRDARAIEPLIAALDDSAAGMREAAAKALGQIRDARAVEKLIVALNDRSRSVREAAANALGHIGDDRAIAPLTSALNSLTSKDDIILRAAVSKALKKVGGAKALEPVLESETARIERWLRLHQGKACRYVFDRQTAYGDYDERGEGERTFTGEIKRAPASDKEHYKAYQVGDGLLLVLKTPTDLGHIQIVEQSERTISWREVYSWGSTETKTVAVS
jgi:hypothetical protein